MNKKKIDEAIREAIPAGFFPNEYEALKGKLFPLVPKFEQIAFYAPDMNLTKSMFSLLGCREWVNDTVTAKGTIGTEHAPNQLLNAVNVADLSFNYDLRIELELIRYVAGANWHNFRNPHRVNEDGSAIAPFLSHMSYHVEDMAGEKMKYLRAGFHIIQDVQTLTHTNPFLQETKRRYNYVIFDTVSQLGFDLKLIKRIED